MDKLQRIFCGLLFAGFFTYWSWSVLINEPLPAWITTDEDFAAIQVRLIDEFGRGGTSAILFAAGIVFYALWQVLPWSKHGDAGFDD